MLPKSVLTVVLVAIMIGFTTAQSCSVSTQRTQCGALTCDPIRHVCAPCNVSSECYENALECLEGKCVIKPLFKHIDAEIVVAWLLAIVICAVAVVAGIGGGGILVSLYVPLIGIPLSNAVGFSQATIAGQSFFNVCVVMQRHHPAYQPPKATRPVVNYEYLMLLLPVALVGTTLGNLVGKVVPDWSRLVLLYTLLLYILIRVVRRALHQREADRQRLLGSPKGGPETIKASPLNEPPEVLPPVLRQYAPNRLIPIFLVFAVMLGLNVLRSGKVDLMGCGTEKYWAVVGVTVAYNFILFVLFWRYLNGLRLRAADGELPEEVVPFKWTFTTSVVYPLVSIFAGGAASLLGVGGGLVLSFLFLEAGLAPEEASATSSIATLLVAGESCIQFIIQGMVPYDYGLAFFIGGAISTAVGQMLFVRQIRKHGWTYLVPVALGVIILGSIIAITILGIFNIVDTAETHGSFGFGTLCKKQS